jgi:hypothetical protein
MVGVTFFSPMTQEWHVAIMGLFSCDFIAFPILIHFLPLAQGWHEAIEGLLFCALISFPLLIHFLH